MAGPRRSVSAGQWALIAVVALVLVAVVGDVLTSLPKSLSAGRGAPRAQLNGRLPVAPLRVGQPATFDLALVVTAGGAMSPACVAGNLTPAFRVVRVTVFASASRPWRDGESCAGILEAQATAPVVITVVPRFPGRYAVHLYPAVGQRRVGSGTGGTVTIRSASG
ncbi:MAG TPA: hypothetical protein VMW47_02375 [Verrucomicrobiae bacterium]|nr:hypothetical protein [Verrucomicrobiae bacterium]